MPKRRLNKDFRAKSLRVDSPMREEPPRLQRRVNDQASRSRASGACSAAPRPPSRSSRRPALFVLLLRHATTGR